MSESDIYKLIRSRVVSTTGCSVTSEALSVIVTELEKLFTERKQEEIIRLQAELDVAKRGWDYYQELVNSHGFEGITDLLSKHRQVQEDNEALRSQLNRFLSVSTDKAREARDLRQKAEAIENACDAINKKYDMNSPFTDFRNCAQRLRTKADEIERGGV